MQNRYVGDIGDYGKYALLRCLVKSGYSLGINWYLTPDESHNADGKHTTYLQKGIHRNYDEELFDCLKELVDNNRRSVFQVQQAMIFPENTLFYDDILEFGGVADVEKRRMIRKTWHTNACNQLENSELVFLDPDNGFQVDSVSLTSQKGNKYIGLTELISYYTNGKSIVFYNHRERKKEEDYLDKFRTLQRNPAFEGAVWQGLKFPSGTVRDYIFILQPNHAVKITEQIDTLLQTQRAKFFSSLQL